MNIKQKYFLGFTFLLIFILTDMPLAAVNPSVKEEVNISEKKQLNTKPQKKSFKKSKRKKSGWLKNLFKRNPEKGRKLFRVMKKILLWSVLVFIPSFILFMVAAFNENTFIGSLYDPLLGISTISLYAGLIALLFVITLRIGFLFKNKRKRN